MLRYHWQELLDGDFAGVMRRSRSYVRERRAGVISERCNIRRRTASYRREIKPLFNCLISAASSFAAASARELDTLATPTHVIELSTLERCGSCPRAEAWLSKLKKFRGRLHGAHTQAFISKGDTISALFKAANPSIDLQAGEIEPIQAFGYWQR